METRGRAGGGAGPPGVRRPVTEPVSGLCPHVGVCGGCAFQDRPYPQQTAEKEEIVRRVVSPFSPDDILPLIPSPEVYYYRNKMEFAFGGLKDGPVLLGLRAKGRFDRVVDLMECRLLSPETGALLAAARRWATEEKLPTYHLKSHRGFLRYLVVREGKNTGHRMVHLVTTEGTFDADRFRAALKSAGGPLTTVIWSVNAGLSDVAAGERRAVLEGEGHIEDSLEGKRFRISPSTFFQTNTRGAERLYSVVRDFLGSPLDTLFDLYCGSGSIGLFLADRTRQLIGVELNPAAVQDARDNAARLGVSSAEFHALDAAAFAQDPRFQSLWESPGAVAVVDPPRPGLQKEVRQLLLDRPVARWVYVSCNPEALARDLPLLMPRYRLVRVQGVDLFPHTPHVETAVLLERRG